MKNIFIEGIPGSGKSRLLQVIHEKFHGTGYLAECAFMQNIMETLILFYQLDDEEILNFYRRLFDKIDKTSFRLLYLYCDNISEIVRTVKEERTDLQGNMLWYNTMMAYIRQSPYGKSHNDIVRDCVMEHFQRRQQLELSIMENVVGEYGHVIVAKKWNSDQVFEAIDMDHNVFNNGK